MLTSCSHRAIFPYLCAYATRSVVLSAGWARGVKCKNDHRSSAECATLVPISLLLDSEGAIALSKAFMRSLNVRFNPAGPGQHIPAVERAIRTINSKVRGIINTLPYSLSIQ